MRQNNWTWAALALLGLVALLYYLNSRFPGALADENGKMRLVYGIGWLVLIGSSFAVGWRHNAGLALKQMLAWTAIAFILSSSTATRTICLASGISLAGASPRR